MEESLAGTTRNEISRKSQRQCPAVVVARGEPLTAAANSTPLPVHPHPRCTPPPTHLSLPPGLPSQRTLSSQRPPAQTPRPSSSLFARRIRGHRFGCTPNSPEMQFRFSFCRGPSLRVLFPLLKALTLVSTLSYNLDLNLEREPSLEITRVLLISYQEANQLICNYPIKERVKFLHNFVFIQDNLMLWENLSLPITISFTNEICQLRHIVHLLYVINDIEIPINIVWCKKWKIMFENNA